MSSRSCGSRILFLGYKRFFFVLGEGTRRFSLGLPSVKCCYSSNAMNNLTSKKQKVCSLSATGMQKPEEKDIRGVTCFMEGNGISPREVA